ncbi:MAG: serine/threonine-protein kinase [Planctomycetota bacterium]
MLRAEILSQLAIETGLIDAESAASLAMQHQFEAPDEPFERWVQTAPKGPGLSERDTQELLRLFASTQFRCMVCRTDFDGESLPLGATLYCPVCQRPTLKRKREDSSRRSAAVRTPSSTSTPSPTADANGGNGANNATAPATAATSPDDDALPPPLPLPASAIRNAAADDTAPDLMKQFANATDNGEGSTAGVTSDLADISHLAPMAPGEDESSTFFSGRLASVAQSDYQLPKVILPDGLAPPDESQPAASASAIAIPATASTDGPNPYPIDSDVHGWHLEGIAGQGGCSTVYMAFHPQLQQRAALKVLHRMDEPTLERFRFEATIGQRLRHENLVRVLDSGEYLDLPFLVMEWVDGGTAEDQVRAYGPLSIPRAAQVAMACANALAVAHRNGIIHRDLKPANILLDSNGAVKITDFGLAREERRNVRMTEAGQIMGTPNYMSPEQALGQEVTVATDIYLLGCSLWFLLTGRPPFTGNSAHAVLGQHISAPFPSLKDVRPDAPPAIDQVLQWMCEKDPANRPSSMRDVGAMLETIMQV